MIKPVQKPVPAKPIPKELPAFEFVTDTPTLAAQDLDILKLTALFVARNGRQFMNSLLQHESRNYQFDFLRSSHPLFAFFTKLVEQYTLVLIPKNVTQKLKKSIANKYGTLKEIRQRVEYQQYVDEAQRKAKEQEEEEKTAFASIDWHDFVVVETIEFSEADDKLNLPPPLSVRAIESMSMAQKRAAALFAQEPEPFIEETRASFFSRYH